MPFLGGVAWLLAGMVPRDLLHALFVLCDLEYVVDSLLNQPLTAKLPRKVIGHSFVGNLVHIGIECRIRLILEPVHLQGDSLATPSQGQGDSAEKSTDQQFDSRNLLALRFVTYLSGKLSYSFPSQ